MSEPAPSDRIGVQVIGTRPTKERPKSKILRIWLVSLIACTVGVALAFGWLDLPIARSFMPHHGQLGGLAAGLGSAVLLSGEGAVALTLIAVRLRSGHLSPLGQSLTIACLTSLCGYSIGAGALKLLFGVPGPGRVLRGGFPHVFDIFGGSPVSSFPSSHMILAGAFAGVFMRLYASSRWPFTGLLFLGAVLLIAGDWHFLSDVIAGSFIGISLGLLAGELWQVHSTPGTATPSA